MSGKKKRVADLARPFATGDVDPRYAGFFDCFNRELFFEAHEVLEDLWLEDRNGPDGAFYKGLIQLAGAFVHVQKRRYGPAAALLRLAMGNLKGYAPTYRHLKLDHPAALAEQWLKNLETGELSSQLPKLHLDL